MIPRHRVTREDVIKLAHQMDCLDPHHYGSLWVDKLLKFAELIREETMFEYKAMVENVVDGDTIDVAIDLGFKIQTRQRIRLAHVDTPEKGQAGYTEAKTFVQEAVLGKAISLRTNKVSKWGYYLGHVTLEDGRNLSAMLLEEGLAKPYEGGTK